MGKVLIVDDEEGVRQILTELLVSRGFSTVACPDGASGVSAFASGRPDAVLLDYRMPGQSGLEVLCAMRETDPSIPVIFLTACADVHSAVEAMRAGAYDYITKPPDMDALCAVLSKAIEKAGLEREVARLKSAVGASVGAALGRSESMKAVVSRLVRVASSDFSVVIQGETGTGKSTLAELIHNMSLRSGGPFVRVDLGAIPEGLIESELFGCERGAYTGADRARSGFFETASSGTLFIDELENTSAALQAKLLSAVEEKKVFRIGSSRAVPIDVRIIAASNADLKQLVRERRFREDLFFRLNEFMVTLPPLRERREDVSFLAERFLGEACLELKRPRLRLSEGALDLLLGYGWAGNVRELKNVIRRAALVSAGPELGAGDIDLAPGGEQAAPEGVLPLKEASARAAREAEKAAITRALRLTAGNKSAAASLLKVDYKTLLTKIRAYEI